MARLWLPLTVGLVDLVMVVLATVAAVLARASLPFLENALDVDEHVSMAAVYIVLGWLTMLMMVGSYRRTVFGAGTDEYRLVLNASLATAAMIGVGAYLVKFPLSRGFFVLLFGIGIPLLLLGRFLLRRAVQHLRRDGALAQRVLLVGTPGYIAEVGTVLRRETWLGYQVTGCLVPRQYAGLLETASGVPVLGYTDEVAAQVAAREVDIVFFSGGAFETAAELRRVAWELEDHGHVQIVVAPNVTDVSHERISIRPVAGLPLVYLERPRSRQAAMVAKRGFDILAAALLVLLFSPLVAVTAAWIKLADRGPVLFRQTRVGRDGELFGCHKLRSMVVGAEALQAQLPARSDHTLFKMTDDPRITRPGRFIRRFSVDELPQLWNVLRGEMSLVGPRPPLPDEVDRYDDDVRQRLKVRPGLTGLWQVSGRADLSWEDTVRLDLYYVDNWSLVQDLVILLRTVTAVVRGSGAY